MLKTIDQLVSYSLLPKDYEKSFKQIILHIENYLSQFLCGVRKGYSPQNAVLSMIEKWEKND